MGFRNLAKAFEGGDKDGKRLIPDKIENFNVYLGTAADSNRLIGITDEITLPKLENMSETINLAGMAGGI